MNLRPLLLVALVAPLAACGGAHRGMESAHQPVVTRSNYAIDLLAGPDGLASGEAQRLRDWLDTLAIAYGDTITLDDPNASPGVRGDVAAIAGSYGLGLSRGLSVAAPTAPGMVRVTVARATASVPSCGALTGERRLVNFDQHTSHDFGCAVNGNMAAMVADANDLVRGKSDDAQSRADVNAKAIGGWRVARPTGAGGTIVKSETTGGR